MHADDDDNDAVRCGDRQSDFIACMRASALATLYTLNAWRAHACATSVAGTLCGFNLFNIM